MRESGTPTTPTEAQRTRRNAAFGFTIIGLLLLVIAILTGIGAQAMYANGDHGWAFAAGATALLAGLILALALVLFTVARKARRP